MPSQTIFHKQTITEGIVCYFNVCSVKLFNLLKVFPSFPISLIVDLFNLCRITSPSPHILHYQKTENYMKNLL
jgi:hypothetical protein